jgi:hypothetical protein
MTERTRLAFATTATTDAGQSPSFTRKGAAWSEVAFLADAMYRVRLGGLLRSAWMIGVCSGLAQARLSIQRAHARRLSHDGTWIAELHVVALGVDTAGAADPMDLPLIRFAEESPSESSKPLVLRGYELIPSTDHGGTLRLDFRAQDAVGLLGSLLTAFARLSLLPVEMHIDTRDQEAHDCLWLATATGSKPTQTDWSALNQLLAASVSH